MRAFKLLVLALILAPAAALPHSGGRGRAAAAEFDLDAGRTVLRRLQFCLDCGSALLVTRVHPGVMVRCPDCGREQPRLADQYLLTQIYQICRLCGVPLDPAGRAAGEVVECANCHTRQALSPDAFPAGPNLAGLGYVPGFPPGSGKKVLLYSPERPDAAITPIPLDGGDGMEGAALPPPRPELAAIPRPRPAAPPLLEAPPPAPAPDAKLAVTSAPRAIDVPAVTVELFGGRLPSAGRPADAGGDAAGNRVVARVDGTPIYSREVDRVLLPILARLREKAGPGGAAEAAKREGELRGEILDRLIDRELAVREAAALGHRPDPAAVREREAELAGMLREGGADLRREAERDVIMADMRRRVAEKPARASPEAVRDYYRQHREEMRRPRRLALDQLIIYQDRAGRADGRDYREIALEVSRELEAGKRFDELRARYDEFGPAAGIPHAEPVLQPEAAYATQILASAGDLRRGAVFGPLFMEGMALFGKVADERPAGPAPFEEVEKDIRRLLENRSAEQNLDAWFKSLRRKAKIEIL